MRCDLAGPRCECPHAACTPTLTVAFKASATGGAMILVAALRACAKEVAQALLNLAFRLVALRIVVVRAFCCQADPVKRVPRHVWRSGQWREQRINVILVGDRRRGLVLCTAVPAIHRRSVRLYRAQVTQVPLVGGGYNLNEPPQGAIDRCARLAKCHDIVRRAVMVSPHCVPPQRHHCARRGPRAEHLQTPLGQNHAVHHASNDVAQRCCLAHLAREHRRECLRDPKANSCHADRRMNVARDPALPPACLLLHPGVEVAQDQLAVAVAH
mmetsp:Transcript_16259/g.50474  ORF Transcript_16259/g.50474 Transcript_16259/m.50474 type:complete len:270 (+) Transcript_16259:70-879(+)